ncbi:MAG: 2-oxoacid:acceptor oxidoreductase family protein [bacterium]
MSEPQGRSQAPAQPQAQSQWQLRFGGMGGQGVVVIGDTIAQAAALAGWHVAGSTSYGAQARGGASKADVVLSREPIDFPHVEQPDVLVLISQEAYVAYTASEPHPPLVIVDSFVVHTGELAPGVRLVEVNATGLALDALDNRQGANFVMIGAFLAATGILTVEELDAAIEHKLSRRWWELNKRALRVGFDAVNAPTVAEPSSSTKK